MARKRQSHQMWGHIAGLEELVDFRARIQARSDGHFHCVVPVSLQRVLHRLL